VFPTELNRAVPRQTVESSTREILRKVEPIVSTREILRKAEPIVPMKGRGQDQNEKWGISQYVLGMRGLLEREKERSLVCWVSRIEMVTIVFGRGSDEATEDTVELMENSIVFFPFILLVIETGWPRGRESYITHVSIRSILCCYNVKLKV